MLAPTSSFHGTRWDGHLDISILIEPWKLESLLFLSFPQHIWIGTCVFSVYLWEQGNLGSTPNYLFSNRLGQGRREGKVEKKMWREKVTLSVSKAHWLWFQAVKELHVAKPNFSVLSPTKALCQAAFVNFSFLGFFCRPLDLAAPSTLLSSWGYKVYAFWLTQTWLAQW